MGAGGERQHRLPGGGVAAAALRDKRKGVRGRDLDLPSQQREALGLQDFRVQAGGE